MKITVISPGYAKDETGTAWFKIAPDRWKAATGSAVMVRLAPLNERTEAA